MASGDGTATRGMFPGDGDLSTIITSRISIRNPKMLLLHFCAATQYFEWDPIIPVEVFIQN
jgi:hypothetical protein